MFDPEKLGEYKIRILLSLLIILLVIFAIFYRGISGIASIEVIFVGLLFSIVSLLHASWAILKIKKLLDNTSIEENNPSYEKLEEQVKEQPQNKDLRFQLAESYLSATETEKGFNESDYVIEKEYSMPMVHQGYIEPHACLASMTPDGKADLWCCTQGHYNVRALCADIMGMESSQLRVTPSEIGGGFGGKTTIFIEPIALALSLKSGKPVKLVMTRDEVFKATGPTVSSSMDVKIGMNKHGIITAGEANLRYQGGAFPNGTVEMGAQSAFAAYDLKAVRTKGWNVLTNRPKQAAYRAPGAPQAIYAVESVVDELCQKLNLISELFQQHIVYF